MQRLFSVYWLPVIFCLLAVFAAWGPVHASTPNQAPSFPAQATANANANLRDGPGTTYAKVGGVKEGDSILLTGCNDDCTWYKLENGSWIFAELVQVRGAVAGTDVSTSTASVADSAPSGTATAVDTANLRSGPGTNYARVGGVTEGQALTIKGRNNSGDWLQLADGTWIAAFLVKVAPENLPVVETTSPVAPAAVTASPAARPAFFIVDFPQLYGKSVTEAETVLGAPALVVSLDPGEMEAIPDGGEARDYNYQGISLSVQYDRNETVRGMSMGDSFASGNDLMHFNIPMSDWQKVIKGIGLPATQEPNHTYPLTYEWQNLRGFRIRMDADVDSGAWWLLVVTRAE